MIQLRLATLEDAVWVSTRLRPDDEQEVRTMTGSSPRWVIPSSFRKSARCMTMRCADKYGRATSSKPLAIFGVANDPRYPNIGNVWMVATPGIRRISLAFIKEAPSILEDLSIGYDGLFCLSDDRNTLHQRWLLLCGFHDVGVRFINEHQFTYFVRFNNTNNTQTENLATCALSQPQP